MLSPQERFMWWQKLVIMADNSYFWPLDVAIKAVFSFFELTCTCSAYCHLCLAQYSPPLYSALQFICSQLFIMWAALVWTCFLFFFVGEFFPFVLHAVQFCVERLVSCFSLHFLVQCNHFHFIDNKLLVACQWTRHYPRLIIHYEEPSSGADLQIHPMKVVHIRISHYLVYFCVSSSSLLWISVTVVFISNVVIQKLWCH